MRKRGRPKSDKPLKHVVSVHMDSNTKKMLDRIAKNEQRDVSYIIRKAIELYIKAK